MSPLHLILLSFLSLTGTALADATDYARRSEMNGIHFKDFKNFEKNWRLVTSRYREDTREIRLTYANGVAWDALLHKSKDFPEGAMLAKIGYRTGADPSFLSSRVPSEAKRFQFMVRNKKAYSATSGWGYALFNSNGETFAGEPTKAAQACAACHALVPNRGFVFSEPMAFVSDVAKDSKTPRLAVVRFAQAPIKNVPELITKFFPENVKFVSTVIGALAQNPISGTLDEIRPELIAEAQSSGRPAMILSASGTAFSVIWLANAGQCPNELRQFSGLIRYPSANADENLLKFDKFCQ